jgi:Ca2+-binding EF-hand superfamily protein
MNSTEFKDGVLEEINAFRKNPSSVVKRCETVRTGMSRFRGNEKFLKDLDQFINYIKHAEPLHQLNYSDILSEIAESHLDSLLNSKFTNFIDDDYLHDLLKERIVGQSVSVLVADEGAEMPPDVINKILLNKNDTERKGRKMLLEFLVKYIGIAHRLNKNNENVVVIIMSDRAFPKPVRERKKAIGDLSEFKEAFDWFDVNKTGRIDPKETINAMKKLGYDYKNPALYEIMKELDTPEFEKTLVDFDTFVDHICDRIDESSTEDGLRRIFNLYVDDPRADTITLSNLKKIANELGDAVYEKELKELFERSSGKVELTFQEFHDFMVKNYPAVTNTNDA